jgi:cytochrome c biogenesis factor
MDVHTLLKSFVNSIHSIAEYNILGVSIFIWLALFIGLFLVFVVIEKDALRKTRL